MKKTAFLSFMFYSVWALSQSGELDLAFNGDGIFIQNLNGQDRAYCMTIQDDDKILVGGYFLDETRDLFLMRLDIYGNPDLTFGTQGLCLL